MPRHHKKYNYIILLCVKLATYTHANTTVNIYICPCVSCMRVLGYTVRNIGCALSYRDWINAWRGWRETR